MKAPDVPQALSAFIQVYMDNKQFIFANIIIEISHEQLDRPFQYRIPEPLLSVLKVGDCVSVPFGKANRILTGYVIELSDTHEFPIDKIKYIEGIKDDQVSIEGSLISLAYWIKSHYGGTMIQALKTVIPVKRKMNHKSIRQIDLLLPRDAVLPIIEECENKHQTARLRALKALLDEPTLPYSLMHSKLNVSAPTLKSLQDKGYIRISETEYYRNPVVHDDKKSKSVNLSDEQKNIITSVIKDFDDGCPGKYLIHGITGSGKTEVYLGVAEEMVKRGKQVIVMIPEISLTFQTLLRFYKRFGDRVSVINSVMSAGERYDQHVRAMNGEIDVIIGPRSALFTPFRNLGAVIIDEEHEGSYKSENTPRYHARECAEYISTVRGASLVLGSATPSLEAYYKAQKGIYKLFTLDKRLTGGALPTATVVDLREELRLGNRSIFSDKLKILIEDRLSKGEQSILFINRRGYVGSVTCRSCGYVVKCPHCDVSMTEHMNGRMVCHYCGYTIKKPALCPECGSKYIAGFKGGTEKVEEEVKNMFPSARVLRMDADTTKEKGSMENILRAFADHEADILVGTQMIVKGHDFPLVTLVGILAADLSLNVSDYHSAERTFALLTQAAGRAGRGTRPGEVVIQTYQPNHYSVLSAREQNYLDFYEEEIEYRELAAYPPVWHLLAVLYVSDDKTEGERISKEHKKIADVYLKETNIPSMSGYTIGPTTAVISKIKDKYRHVLYIKHPNNEILVEIKDLLEKYNRDNPARKVLTFYDFDPINSL